jgi:hypothetical protein
MEISDRKLSIHGITDELVFHEEFVQISSTGEENSEKSENLKHKSDSPCFDIDQLKENSNYINIKLYLNSLPLKPP